MAHNEITMAAAPEAVFDVLSDPRSYARWVVGSQKIRAADAEWPAPGASFDHAVGIGPFTVADGTTVRVAERPRRLEMIVRARPFTVAVVSLHLRAEGGGTRVEMDERAADLRSRIFFNRLTDPLVRLRNQESLRRLKALAEGEEPLPTGTLPPRESPREASVKGSSKPAT